MALFTETSVPSQARPVVVRLLVQVGDEGVPVVIAAAQIKVPLRPGRSDLDMASEILPQHLCRELHEIFTRAADSVAAQ